MGLEDIARDDNNSQCLHATEYSFEEIDHLDSLQKKSNSIFKDYMHTPRGDVKYQDRCDLFIEYLLNIDRIKENSAGTSYNLLYASMKLNIEEPVHQGVIARAYLLNRECLHSLMEMQRKGKEKPNKRIDNIIQRQRNWLKSIANSMYSATKDPSWLRERISHQSALTMINDEIEEDFLNRQSRLLPSLKVLLMTTARLEDLQVILDNYTRAIEHSKRYSIAARKDLYDKKISFGMRIFSITQDLSVAESIRDDMIESCRMSCDDDIDMMLRRLTRRVYSATSDPLWGERLYSHIENMPESSNSSIARSMQKARLGRELFGSTRNIAWAKRSYEQYVLTICRIPAGNALLYSKEMKELCFDAYNATGNDEWLDMSTRGYEAMRSLPQPKFLARRLEEELSAIKDHLKSRPYPIMKENMQKTMLSCIESPLSDYLLYLKLHENPKI